VIGQSKTLFSKSLQSNSGFGVGFTSGVGFGFGFGVGFTSLALNLGKKINILGIKNTRV
jgi:hypothetical protein